jgi:hypothetical protein
MNDAALHEPLAPATFTATPGVTSGATPGALPTTMRAAVH